MEVLIHIGRTFLLVAVLTAVVLLIQYLHLGWLGVVLIICFLGCFVYFSARWHALWAPIAEELQGFAWQSGSGKVMRTVVEKAKVHAATLGGASAVRQTTFRISIYNQTNPGRERRVNRVVVGDDAIYLGQFGELIWFYIADRFYAKVDGLTAYATESAEIKYNRPMNEVTYRGRTKHAHVMRVQIDGENQKLDLIELAKNAKP